MTSSESTPSIEVTDNVGASRYEIQVDGRPAGLALYDRTDGVVTFTHTEVAPEFEGQGLGGKIVTFALDAARDDGLRVVPTCPFFAEYIRRHPVYEDLVDRGE
jgi:predicted GNAT family acetyltransferase